MLHSFSALDIQKMRNNLKSSKSYPHDLKEKVAEEDEEAMVDVEQEKKVQENAAKKEVKPETRPAALSTAPKVVKQVGASSNVIETAAVPVEETKKPENQLINVREGMIIQGTNLTF